MAKRPHIGIDVTSALVQGGGIGRYTRELIRALAKQDGRTQYHLFSAKPPAKLPVSDPLPNAKNFRHMPASLDERWLYRIWYRARLPLNIQRFTGKIDLFHSPDFVLPPVGNNIPTLLTVHDMSFHHFPEHYEPSLVKYLNQVVPWSVNRATHILADSEATRYDLIGLTGVSPAKVTVLYSGVGNNFRPITDNKTIRTMREKYKLGTKPYLLSVGTVQPRKNYVTLIRAFAQIANDWPHNLAIAGGKGWRSDAFYEEIRRLNMSERIRMLGFVDDDDLPALYSDAALFLFPSLYEGFGLPILEAMACGVPVIASDNSSLPEVVGEAGMLLDAFDVDRWSGGIHRLLLDMDERMMMVGQGARQVYDFTWDAAAKQLRTIYKQLLRDANE